MSYFALVPAAGSGARMGEGIPKQYLPLLGKPMIYHSLQTLCFCPSIRQVYVVLAENDDLFEKYDWSCFSGKIVPLYCGGETRALSVLNGLNAAALDENEWVLVHDAARPCLDEISLQRLIVEASQDEAGGLLALPVADTLKRADKASRVEATQPREGLWQAQTPQMFRFGLLKKALTNSAEGMTDESSALELLGYRPKLVLGDPRNFKVTYSQDKDLAEWILKGKKCE